MINPFREVNWRPDTVARRSFAQSLVIGFPIVGIVLEVAGRLIKHHWAAGPLWLGCIGCLLGVVFWTLPAISLPFYLLWYFAACSVGIVVSNVVVSLFYYLVITPTGFVMRCLGRDPMQRKFERESTSYWKPAEKIVDVERYFRQY